MAKILVVEDTPELSASVLDCLKTRQHIAEHSADIAGAMSRLAVSEYDLIILDWNLPDGQGIDVLRWYRKQKGLAPILMLTARSEIGDKETGFEAGADDYLTKPFSMRELAARVDALLRRPRDIIDQTLSFGSITIHSNAHRVFKDGQEIRLLPKEFALLDFLVRHAGQIFSTEQLLERVWTSESESLPDTVVTTVKRLRNRIDAPGQPSLIENIRGVGYRINK
jgi:DNA-binding response OmpR family regulator